MAVKQQQNKINYSCKFVDYSQSGKVESKNDYSVSYAAGIVYIKP